MRVDIVRGVATLVLAIAACKRSGTAAHGELVASWSGSDTGRVVAGARTSWCPVARRLEVLATKDDRGFGLVLYPVQDSIAPGTYPGFDPGVDTVHRPGSAGAVRWFAERSVVAYQSDSGSIQAERGDRGLELTFGFRMRSLNGRDTIRATGSARDLAPGPCAADSVPGAAPRQ